MSLKGAKMVLSVRTRHLWEYFGKWKLGGVFIWKGEGRWQFEGCEDNGQGCGSTRGVWAWWLSTISRSCWERGLNWRFWVSLKRWKREELKARIGEKRRKKNCSSSFEGGLRRLECSMNHIGKLKGSENGKDG